MPELTTIYKYEISLGDKPTVLHMPVDAKVLTVQMKDGRLCMWALVVPREGFGSTEARSFCVFGTGHVIEIDRANLTYVGTVQQFDGALVWHVFERTN